MRLIGRKKIGVAAMVISALVMLAAVVAFAQGGPQEGPGGPPPPPPPRGGRGFGPGGPGGPGRGGPIPFLRDLNLTDAQKAQVKQLVESFESSTKELREKMRSLSGGPEDMLKDGAFDEATVRANAQARAQAQIELEVAHARLLSQVYNVLTAEQKATLAERRQQMEQRRKEREAERGARQQDDR